MLLSICQNPDTLKTIQIVKVIITILKICVPALLILSLSLQYMDAVKSNDDKALSKVNKSIVPKAVAAIVIFLIPTFVNLIFKIVSTDANDYYECLEKATTEGINAARIEVCQTYINRTKNSLSPSDYRIAYAYLDKIEDENSKKILLESLMEVKELVEINELLIMLESKYDKEKYDLTKKRINALEDSDIKEEFKERFSKIKTGNLLNVAAGTYTGSSADLTYYVNVPANATTNMPLILFLHGDDADVSYAKDSPLLRGLKSVYGEEYPFIIVAPHGGMWKETSGRLDNVMDIVNTVCMQYQCDTNRIIASGVSRGAIGVWHIVNDNPGFFHAAIPVSCGAYTLNAGNFRSTKVWAFSGNSNADGNSEASYANSMTSIVNSIRGAGGEATMTIISGATHSNAATYAYRNYPDLWGWASN